jgi:hypothetical protein
MTEGDWGVIVQMLQGAYLNHIFQEDLQVSTYYDFLKKYDPGNVWNACRKWIEQNKFPPTISDIIECLPVKLTADERNKIEELKM